MLSWRIGGGARVPNARSESSGRHEVTRATRATSHAPPTRPPPGPSIAWAWSLVVLTACCPRPPLPDLATRLSCHESRIRGIEYTEALSGTQALLEWRRAHASAFSEAGEVAPYTVLEAPICNTSLADPVGLLLLIDPSTGEPAPHCSGTLLAPDILVTAAHCTHDYSPSQLLFRTSDGSTTHRVYQHYTHPSYDFDCPGTADLSLVQLATSTESARVAQLATHAPTTNEHLLYAGYGYATSPDQPGQVSSVIAPGTLHCARNRPSAILQWSIINYAPDQPHTCRGDSGGAVLRATGSNGTPELAGVVSYADFPQCSQMDAAIRIDVFRHWIENKLQHIERTRPQYCGRPPLPPCP